MIRVSRITRRVRDQQEALKFYTEKLSFEKRTDLPMGPTNRWMTVASKDDPGLELVLQPSDWFEGKERQQHEDLIGKDPTIVFQVDDCRATYEKLRSQGIEFSRPPTDQGYGIEADGRDLYGNTIVFMQFPESN